MSSSTSNVSRTVTKAVLAIEQAEGVGARVRRSIGSQSLRNLTPFLMLDHFKASEGAGFPDHPHRGQTTVTYMLHGKSLHEDFCGNKGLLEPGDVQWMTAGKGIMHAEMPIFERDLPPPEGMQLWVDLPERFKSVEPSYQEKKAKEIDSVRPSEGAKITVISGESHGVTGFVRPLGGCHFYDFQITKRGGTFFQPIPKGWTSFLYLLTGSVKIGPTAESTSTTSYEKHHTLVLSSTEEQDGVQITSDAAEDGEGTRGILVAGEPLDQPVVQYGPFVTTSERAVREAFADFRSYRNGFENARGWKSEIGGR